MAKISFSEGTSALKTRTRLAYGAICLYIGVQLLEIMVELAVGGGYRSGDRAILQAIDGIAIASFVTYLISAIIIATWIYRAHANLFAAGIEGLEFTPGWSVGWFFIPFANLVKPFQAMRELWNASHDTNDRFDRDAPSLLSSWWGTLIAGSILTNVGTRLGNTPEAASGAQLILALANVLTVVCALLVALIIREVYVAQQRMLEVDQIFS